MDCGLSLSIISQMEQLAFATEDDASETDWQVRIYEKRPFPYLSKPLIERMHRWNEVWSTSPEELGETQNTYTGIYSN